jgi:hypothetical protein
MTNTTADITLSRTHNTTTYESKEFGIILAAVDRLGDYSWRATCYFSDEEYDEEKHGSRTAAETVALRHTQAVIDAL